MSEPRTAIRRRVLAYLADAVAVVGCVAAFQRVRKRSPTRGVVSTLAITGVLAFPYHILLEGAVGQTLGKRLVGIRVTAEDGAPCSYQSAAIRTVFRFVDWLPVAYIAGLASIALTERHQRLGDVAAGTIVVRTDGRFDDPRGGD